MMGPLNPKQFHSRIWGVVLVLALLLTFLCSNLYSIQYTNGPEYAAQHRQAVEDLGVQHPDQKQPQGVEKPFVNLVPGGHGITPFN